MQYPKSIQNLITHLSKLPSVGPKTAERYIFYLLKQNPEDLQKFAQAVAELKENIKICNICHTIAETNPCAICSNDKRDKSIICVIATPRDMLSLEMTREYNGHYHVLGGVIDSIEGVGPDKLNVKQLIDNGKIPLGIGSCLE